MEIVFGSQNGYVSAVNHDGTIVPGWPANLGASVDGSPIIIDLDGNGTQEILISRQEAIFPSALYGFNSNGTPFPGFPKPLIQGRIMSPVAGDFDGDGLIEVFAADFFFPTYSSNLYLWEFTGAATTTNLPWPMFHHDPQHTGKYP